MNTRRDETYSTQTRYVETSSGRVREEKSPLAKTIGMISLFDKTGQPLDSRSYGYANSVLIGQGFGVQVSQEPQPDDKELSELEKQWVKRHGKKGAPFQMPRLSSALTFTQTGLGVDRDYARVLLNDRVSDAVFMIWNGIEAVLGHMKFREDLVGKTSEPVVVQEYVVLQTHSASEAKELGDRVMPKSLKASLEELRTTSGIVNDIWMKNQGIETQEETNLDL